MLETNSNIKLNLADIPLPNGILRIDRNISTDPTQVRLGHYSLPVLNGPIKKETRQVKGHQVEIISNGEYQLAMVPLQGWSGLETVNAKGLHPVSDESAVSIATDSFTPGQEPKVYATLMLWKKAGEKWSNSELVPVKSITQNRADNSITVSFEKGAAKTVKFE